MKKLCIVIILTALTNFTLTSCGTKKEDKKEGSEGYGQYDAGSSDKSSKEDLIAQGKVLMKDNDCKTCHHVTKKILGPPYADIAKKYESTPANISMLADKIKRGGSGVWGQVQMTPHDMSKGDAEKIVMYVLSLNGDKPSE